MSRGRHAVVAALTLAVLPCAGAAGQAAGREGVGPPLARVSGVVFDSVAMRAVTGAVVQLIPTASVGTGHTRRSDAAGAFRFDSVAFGEYLLGFHHQALDSLGLTTPLMHVVVRTAGEIRAMLAVPSPRTLVQRVCSTDVTRDSTGLLVGYVRHTTDHGLPSLGLARVEWTELTVGPEGIRTSRPQLDAPASVEGGFAACGVPLGGSVLVRGFAKMDSSGFVELEIPRSGLVRRDILVGTARMVDLAVADDSASDSVRVTTRVARGDGVLRGTVRRSNGSPLEGARLLVWGTGIEVVSGAGGQFSMPDLPTGTHTLEVRALGFLPVRRPVDILADTPGSTEVTMESLAAVLDTIKVTARQRIWLSPQMAEFEARKRSGFGHFLDPEAIEKRDPIFVSDLFRMTPGLVVTPGQAFGSRVLMRGTGFARYCAPAVFLDGMKVWSEGDLDQLVSANDVRAVEVYTRASNVPPQFNTMDGCGSIVIWTGRRQAARQR